MMNPETIELVDESKPPKARGTGTDQIIEISIDTGLKSVPLQILVPDRDARLSEIVPLAQAICTRLTEAVTESLDAPITCKKGCPACCHYLVALSVPEIHYLQEILSQMSKDYHVSILHACLKSAKKILHNTAEKPEMSENTELNLISRWYEGLNSPCPFLSGKSCDIYEHRPLACREYMVTSSSLYCQSGHEIDPDVVKLPVSILEALGQLAAEFDQSEVEGIILPLAFICIDDYFERSGHTWPAIDLVQRFVKIIEESTVSQHQPQTA